MERLNDYIITDKKEISLLLAPFDSSLTVLDFSLIKDSMSNTGYMVSTNSGKYLLKLYSNTTDKIETAAYLYLKDKINIPELLFYDGSKERFPFAYAIMEFLDGLTLIQYLRTNLKYPLEIVYEIGGMCASMRKRKYARDAILDDKLNISKELPKTREKILGLLSEKPAEYLKPEIIEDLRGFIKENSEIFDVIEAESVLCHGDLGYGNIMISGGEAYLIDFEFAYSGSIYNDIGRFFRRKDPDVQTFINSSVCEAFAQGYNSVSSIPLTSNWLALARICDINSMLCLLTYDNVSRKWVEDIERDILYAIN